MYIYKHDITFIEVPDEVSLSFFVSGCPNNCKNCSWKDLGIEPYKLTELKYLELLNKYKNSITCVTFLGGEWNYNLRTLLGLAKKSNLKTCLYTGLSYTKFRINHKKLLPFLDYLKVGGYIEEKGNLDSPTTNQSLIKLPNTVIKGNKNVQ